MNIPSAKTPETTPVATSPVTSDVLRSDHHSHFSTIEIAKAVARHKREHPNAASNPSTRPQKTTPRG
jgi:hypothetical protein